jgi:hypothetical protein
VQTYEQVVADSLAQNRVKTVLLAIFAGLALLLAAGGIYGVVSYSVAQRLHEIGIRIALGAARREVLRLVLSQGMALVGLHGSTARPNIGRFQASLGPPVRAGTSEPRQRIGNPTEASSNTVMVAISCARAHVRIAGQTETQKQNPPESVSKTARGLGRVAVHGSLPVNRGRVAGG